MPLLLFVSLLWAFSFGLIKRHLGGLDSSFVAAVRLGLALLVFLPFVRLRGLKTQTTAALLGMIVGGATTFGVHSAKAGTRVASSATTLGLANPVLSAAEDATAVGLSLTGIFIPVLVPFALICLGAIAWQLLRRVRK